MLRNMISPSKNSGRWSCEVDQSQSPGPLRNWEHWVVGLKSASHPLSDGGTMGILWNFATGTGTFWRDYAAGTFEQTSA